MSLKIHRVDCKYDVVADNTTATKEEVSVLRGDMTSISLEIEDVTRTIQMMDSRINRMEVNQDEQNTGVCYLLGVNYARELEKSKSMEQIEPCQPVVSPPPSAIAGWMSTANQSMPHAAVAAAPHGLVQVNCEANILIVLICGKILQLLTSEEGTKLQLEIAVSASDIKEKYKDKCKRVSKEEQVLRLDLSNKFQDVF
ncbi:uncharacterized protein LOC130996775 [Salvia miltiorrhiza]|uniref:uncharacterized protein LOC130996775 n=1 Tax=Salvia miltiorrhiza TaxID=226208 RepID=UPI0025AD3897|nr:uncharacterized protein LOC130996775 [Salvia miltiorrhiza]